jgi:hypothetical protein
MAQEIITLQDLQEFRSQLLNDLKVLLASQVQPQNQWLRSPDVRKLLKISHGTLQNLRVNGTLPYTKVGGIIYYKLADINNLLNANGA